LDSDRLAALVRRAPDLIALFDADGEILYMSRGAVRLFTGEEPDIILAAEGYARAHRVHPDDLEALVNSFSQAKQRPGETVPISLRTLHVDGSWRHVEGSFINLTHDPEVEGILLSVADVTERIHVEDELRERLRIEAALSAIARDFVDRADIDLDACVRDALASVSSLLSADRANVFILRDRVFHRTHMWAAPGVAPSAFDEVPVDESLWSLERLSHRAPIVVESFDELPIPSAADREVPASREKYALVAVPLVARDQPIGLVAFSTDQGGRRWAAVTVTFLEQFAALLTTALERQRSEEARRLSESRFRRLLQNTPDVVIVVDREGKITFASPAAKARFGYEPEELVGRLGFDLVHPDDLPHVLDAFTRAVTEFEPEVIPMRIQHKEGHWIYVETLGSNLFDDPLVNGLLISTRDVSDRMRIAAALREVEIQFQQAWEHAPIGMGFADRNGVLVKVNPAASRLLGYAESELLATDIAALSHPDDREEALQLQAALFAGEIPEYSWEKRIRHADGSWMWVHVTATLVRDADGTPLYSLAQLSDVTARRDAQERLAHDATHDVLTGLPLRRVILDHLDLALAGARRRGNSAAVLFIDLDHFKRVNDSFGHSAGDALLVEVAGRLRAAIREVDTPGRFGGDEFVVVCPDLADESDVLVIAQRVRSLVGKPFSVHGVDVFIGASVGIAVARPGADAATLLREADSASYRAKQRGRDRCELFDDELRHTLAMRVDTEMALRRALAGDEIVVRYQPIVELSSQRVMGFEALVRWDRPGRGLLAPAAFLAVAEDTGLIIPIGQHVLSTASAQLALWERMATPSPVLTVNVSPRQLLSPELVDDVAEAITWTGVSADRFWLEIPETLMVHDTPQLVTLLHKLGELGIGLALDDFGTGYSSLNHLRYLPVSVLKVDGSFIGELGRVPQGETIVRSVIDLGHALDMRVIAEGVETTDQLTILAELGCDYVQGLVYAPALSASEATQVLQQGVITPN
jgi:diguanylate cyclase (GGDEF)-like protein/PAS domain S-box-containing protein